MQVLKQGSACVCSVGAEVVQCRCVCSVGAEVVQCNASGIYGTYGTYIWDCV